MQTYLYVFDSSPECHFLDPTSFFFVSQIARMATTDKVALHHILVSEAYDFPKPGMVRRLLGALTGEGMLYAEFWLILSLSLSNSLWLTFSLCLRRITGVLVAEGATHQRQRRIMVHLIDVSRLYERSTSRAYRIPPLVHHI